jgi:PhnB protein
MDHMSDKNAAGLARSGPAPRDTQRLTTFFTVHEAAKAIEFYRTTLGAEVAARFDGPDGTVAHAELRLGGCAFALSDPMPDYGLVAPPAEGNAFTMMFWTEDPDGVFERLVAAGATGVSPVTDVFSGDRMGVVRCPFGIRWAIARHDRDVSPEEMAAAAREFLAAAG